MRGIGRRLVVFSFAVWMCASAAQALPSGSTVLRHYLDYIRIPADTALNFKSNKITFSFWIWLLKWDEWGGVFAKGGSDDMFDQEDVQNVCWKMQFGSPSRSPSTYGKLTFGIVTEGGRDTVTQYAPITQVTPRQWHHVLFTYDGDTAAVYLNSRLDGQKIKVGGPLTSGCDHLALYFGPDWEGSVEYMNGAVDELMIWNRVIPPSDTAAVKQGNIGNLQQGLVGYYRFNEGSGTATKDESPRANHATVKGPTWKWLTVGYPTLDTNAVTGGATGITRTADRSSDLLGITRISPNSITFGYHLPSSQRTRVELLDLSGRKIALVSDKVQNVGNHELTVPTRGNAQGVCIVKLTTESVSAQRKVVLTR